MVRLIFSQTLKSRRLSIYFFYLRHHASFFFLDTRFYQYLRPTTAWKWRPFKSDFVFLQMNCLAEWWRLTVKVSFACEWRMPSLSYGRGLCRCVFLRCCVATHTPDLPSSVANRTVNQANVVGDTAVAGANEMSQATVEGVENVAAATGMMNPVGGASQSQPALMQQIIILHCSFSRELLGLEQQAQSIRISQRFIRMLSHWTVPWGSDSKLPCCLLFTVTLLQLWLCTTTALKGISPLWCH